jgi:hypothetical protein
MALCELAGARGKVIRETWKLKITWHCPFKDIIEIFVDFYVLHLLWFIGWGGGGLHCIKDTHKHTRQVAIERRIAGIGLIGRLC